MTDHSAPAPSLIADVTDADFDAQVIERSRQVPVIVDFWAPWCAPCKVLGPILEREVRALGGRVEMRKVDTDANPETGLRFAIRGIPAVKAFIDGEVVTEFTGARDTRFVREWLDALAPSNASVTLAAAEKVLALGEREQAEHELRGILTDSEVGSQAALLLARVLAESGKLAEVEPILAKIDPRKVDDADVEAIRERVAFAREADEFGGEAKARAALDADAGNLDARWALASALAGKGDVSGAFDQLLEMVAKNRKYKEDGARRAILLLLRWHASDDPVARDVRRRLQIVT